jgi:hypothetical protein
MSACDPFPGTTFQEAIKVLWGRFPDGNLEQTPSNGNAFIDLPLSTGGSFRVGLTWQQAKYLAYSELTGDDLKAERLPGDWPV